MKKINFKNCFLSKKLGGYVGEEHVYPIMIGSSFKDIKLSEIKLNIESIDKMGFNAKVFLLQNLIDYPQKNNEYIEMLGLIRENIIQDKRNYENYKLFAKLIVPKQESIKHNKKIRHSFFPCEK